MFSSLRSQAKSLVGTAKKYFTFIKICLNWLSLETMEKSSMIDLNANSPRIELSNLPMPPIANHRLMPSRGRLIKSPEIRHYDQAVKHYFIRLKSNAFVYRSIIAHWLANNYAIKVDLNFYWPKSKLISKKNEPKRIDLDGRLKSTIDAISEICGFDDKHVVEIVAKKLYHDDHRAVCHAFLVPVEWVGVAQDK